MEKGKWAAARLIIGIILIVLFAFVMLQSCAAGLSNSMTGNGEMGGSFGFLTAIFFLVAGIVGIVTRNSASKAGPMVCCVFLWLCFFFSRIGAGSYTDLKIWGVLGFSLGCVYLFAALRTTKGYIIGIVASALYLVLGLV